LSSDIYHSITEGGGLLLIIRLKLKASRKIKKADGNALVAYYNLISPYVGFIINLVYFSVYNVASKGEKRERRRKAVKKLLCIIISILLFASVPSVVLGAYNDYTVGAFYAISSNEEYKELSDSVKNDMEHMYFQWARLVPDDQGIIRFTNLYRKPISNYDNRSEFGVPGNNVEGYANKLDYKTRNPKGKAFLSVFFSAVSYGNGRHSAIEFLNMNERDWEQYIITPLVEMVNGYYNGVKSENLAFDGVVLDFEGIRDSYQDQNVYSIEQRIGLKDKYVRFLRSLKSALGDKELIVVVPPMNVPGYYDGYDLGAINEIADYIFLMAYDYQHFERYDGTIKELEGKIRSIGRYETQPYPLVEEAVDKAINQYGVRPQKLILGLNLHGTKWVKANTVINGQTYSYYTLSYPFVDGIETAVAADPIYLKDSKTCKKILTGEDALKMVDETSLNGAVVEKVEYYYESPRSLYDKYNTIAQKYGIGGIAAWRLGAGSISTWEKLVSMPKEGIYDSLESKKEVPSSKEWTVTFNMPLDPKSVNNQTIYIVDEWGYRIDTKVLCREDGRSVIVQPVRPYREGYTYELVIGKGVKSLEGVSLKQPVRMLFTVASQGK
jgi:hypothetical protein